MRPRARHDTARPSSARARTVRARATAAALALLHATALQVAPVCQAAGHGTAHVEGNGAAVMPATPGALAAGAAVAPTHAAHHGHGAASDDADVARPVGEGGSDACGSIVMCASPASLPPTPAVDPVLYPTFATTSATLVADRGLVFPHHDTPPPRLLA